MIIEGYFTDYSGENKYYIKIGRTGGSYTILDNFDDNATYDNENAIFFAPDPVHITCDKKDLTHRIIIQQAEINLIVNKNFLKELCTIERNSIPVIIYRMHNDQIDYAVFCGFIDPLEFDMPFAEHWSELTLHASSPLAALQDIKINAIPELTKDYATHANVIINYIVNYISHTYAGALDNIYGEMDVHNSYISFIDKQQHIPIINCSIFYGDDEDDYMTLYEALDEVLKYMMCYVYDRYNHPVLCSFIGKRFSSDLWLGKYADSYSTIGSDTTISADDIYTHVKVECEIEPNDDDISLIDDDFMYSQFFNYQKYMTELVSAGEGERAMSGFMDLLNSTDGNESTSYSEGYALDHYCWIKQNDCWDFGEGSYIDYINGEKTDQEYAAEQGGNWFDQSNVLRWLSSNPMKAAFVSFGKGKQYNKKDNSPVASISMKDYLVIPILGRDNHVQNGLEIQRMSDLIKNNQPICKYTGYESKNLIPTDKLITNYIVITGNIILNPLQEKTGPKWNYNGTEGWSNHYYRTMNTTKDASNAGNYVWSATGTNWYHTVPITDNGDGGYYQQKWWSMKKPSTTRNPVYERCTNESGIFGFLDNNKNQQLEYTYTKYGDGSDQISKLPLLACQLKIGEKYCCERLDKGNSGAGKFEWHTLEECKSLNIEPYFTIGVDIKPGDKIIGQSFPIQNNINYHMNLDCTGTSIPIKLTDGIYGVPEFSILGPYNAQWNEIERIHPSFWRHTSWVDHKYYVLELLNSILISDLKLEIKNDLARINSKMTTADNDLIYIDDTSPSADIPLEETFKFVTPLTVQNCIDWGIKYQQSNSYTMTDSGNTVIPYKGMNIYGESELKRPEEIFVDFYHKEYSVTSQIVTRTILTNKFGLSDISHGFSDMTPSVSDSLNGFLFSYPFSKEEAYYCLGYDWSLQTRSCNLKMREAHNYTEYIKEQ